MLCKACLKTKKFYSKTCGNNCWRYDWIIKKVGVLSYKSSYHDNLRKVTLIDDVLLSNKKNGLIRIFKLVVLTTSSKKKNCQGPSEIEQLLRMVCGNYKNQWNKVETIIWHFISHISQFLEFVVLFQTFGNKWFHSK